MQQDTTRNNQYDTLSEATRELNRRGYKKQFAMKDDRLECQDTGKIYSPEDITVDEFHRFEGMTSHDDMSIVYAIEAKDGERGTIIDAYGTYSSRKLNEFLRQLELVE